MLKVNKIQEKKMNKEKNQKKKKKKIKLLDIKSQNDIVINEISTSIKYEIDENVSIDSDPFLLLKSERNSSYVNDIIAGNRERKVDEESKETNKDEGSKGTYKVNEPDIQTRIFK